MKKKSEPIIFFGNERIATGVTTAAPTLQKIIRSGYQVAAVVANHEPSVSRNSRLLEIAALAESYGIPVLVPERLSDISNKLAAYHASLGVLVAYGKIIPQHIIDLFPQGIVNIHPSILPLHRGPTPLESAILCGEHKTGVTLMQLTRAMDAGPIYAQSEVALTGTETKQALADLLLKIGSDMLVDALPGILSGATRPRPQDETQATYDKLIRKEDGQIDWQKPAHQIEREIRAYAGWPKSRTILGRVVLIITQAYAVEMAGPVGTPDIIDKKLIVYSNQGALALERLKPAGKQEMDAAAFLAGYRHELRLRA